MKDSIVNEVMEMVDIFLSLVTINLEDELDRELAAAYIFGMLNGTAQKESLTPEDVQDLMYNIGIDKLRVIGQKVCVTNPNKLENL